MSDLYKDMESYKNFYSSDTSNSVISPSIFMKKNELTNDTIYGITNNTATTEKELVDQVTKNQQEAIPNSIIFAKTLATTQSTSSTSVTTTAPKTTTTTTSTATTTSANEIKTTMEPAQFISKTGSSTQITTKKEIVVENLKKLIRT